MPRKKANPEEQENQALNGIYENEIVENTEDSVDTVPGEFTEDGDVTGLPEGNQPYSDDDPPENPVLDPEGEKAAPDIEGDIIPTELCKAPPDDIVLEAPPESPDSATAGSVGPEPEAVPEELSASDPMTVPEVPPADAAPTSPARRRARRSEAEATAPPQAAEPSSAEPARPRRRRSVEPTSGQNILSIDEESKVQSAEDKEAYLWMELRNSLRTKRPMTGMLGGVERTPNGLPLAIVYYKEKRIVIPASEMNINLAEHPDSTEREMNNRYAQILSWMMGAEIEFTVSGLDKRSGTVVASRRDAMLRKQRHFFLPTSRSGKPLVQQGATAEARVIAVSEGVVRVEVFGVETPIYARDVAWEWVDDCNDYYSIGDRVLVKIMSIDRSSPRNISLTASIRETVPNPARENIKKCVVQGKYVGKVSDVDRDAIYVRLNVGVNAIALAVHDRRTPCRKDDVSFVVTRIDEDAGIAIGIITRIIKQYL